VTGEFFERDDVDDLAEKLDRWTQHSTVPESVRAACLTRIASRYHASYQARTIELALSGAPADSRAEARTTATAPLV
jgi:hypothetical protein